MRRRVENGQHCNLNELDLKVNVTEFGHCTRNVIISCISMLCASVLNNVHVQEEFKV